MKKISIYTIALAVFLILYSLWIFSTMSQIQMSYDESRHAAGGMVWYDYIRTVLYDGYMPFKQFINQYQQMGYNAGWFVNIDPPVDGLIRVPFYALFGPTFFSVRLMALFSAIVSGILTYLIACKITKKRPIALASTIILLMSTLFFMYTAVQALDAMPTVMTGLFWYYFTFVREPKKKYLFRLGKAEFAFTWNLFWGGLALTAATLIKYPAALFIDLFFVLYAVYLIVNRYYQTKQVNLSLFTESGALQIAFTAIVQNLILLAISWKWLQYNLFENHFLERIMYTSSNEVRDVTHDLNYLAVRFPWMGSGTWFSNLTYMIHGYLQRTAFFAIFFVFTVYLLLKKKAEEGIEDAETKKQFTIITIFFLAIYLYFSFRMSNHQIRYISYAFPLVLIGAAYGLYEMISRKWPQRILPIFFVAVLLFAGALFVLDNWMYNKTLKDFGSQNDELLTYLESLPSPRFLLHAPGVGNIPAPSGSWYYNPDFVMFTFMRAKEGYNPFNFKQNAPLYEYPRGTANEVEQASAYLVNQLKGIPTTVPVYVVLYRYHEPEFYTNFGNNFLKNGFQAKNLTYWTIYYRE